MSDKDTKEPEKKKFKLGNQGKGYTLKGSMIVVILLLLLIPLGMMKSLLKERQERRMDVESEILYSWGGVSTWTGPVISVPYKDVKERTLVKPNDQVEYIQEEEWGSIFVIPLENTMDLQLEQTSRTRSIYTVPLYRARVSMEGVFDTSILQEHEKENRVILYDQARVVLSSSDISGLNEVDSLSWNDENYVFTPYKGAGILRDQMSVPLELNRDSGISRYKLGFAFQGGRRLYILPTAQSFKAHLEADTAALSFIGRYLPTEHVQGEDSFSADWNVHYISANLPSSWTEEDLSQIFPRIVDNNYGEYALQKAILDEESQYDMDYENSLGIGMVDRVSVYLKNDRAQKYALLFLIVPFLCFFLYEVIRNKPIHPMQYLIAAMANLVFYVLLLSISEHLGFNGAYGIAASAVTLMLTLYTLTVFKGKGFKWLGGLMMATMYSYLFIVLQSEDYALLLGAIGLFAILAVVMWLTRKVQWYKETAPGESE